MHSVAAGQKVNANDQAHHQADLKTKSIGDIKLDNILSLLIIKYPSEAVRFYSKKFNIDNWQFKLAIVLLGIVFAKFLLIFGVDPIKSYVIYGVVVAIALIYFGSRIEISRVKSNVPLIYTEIVSSNDQFHQQYLKSVIDIYNSNLNKLSIYSCFYVVDNFPNLGVSKNDVLFAIDDLVVLKNGVYLSGLHIKLQNLHLLKCREEFGGCRIYYEDKVVNIYDTELYMNFFNSVSTISKKLLVHIESQQARVKRMRIEAIVKENRVREELHQERLKKERVELEESKKIFINKHDSNSDGFIDIEDYKDFLKMVDRNQSKIIDVDKKYVRDCLKVNEFLKIQVHNLNYDFGLLTQAKNMDELLNVNSALEAALITYRLTLFHAFSMVASLVSNNMVAFYEIYEKFEENGLFDNHHERKIQELLQGVNEGIANVSQVIKNLETSLSDSISELTYMNNANFMSLRGVIQDDLNHISSQISYSNVLNTVQTYKLHKIERNFSDFKRIN